MMEIDRNTKLTIVKLDENGKIIRDADGKSVEADIPQGSCKAWWNDVLLRKLSERVYPVPRCHGRQAPRGTS